MNDWDPQSIDEFREAMVSLFADSSVRCWMRRLQQRVPKDAAKVDYALNHLFDDPERSLTRLRHIAITYLCEPPFDDDLDICANWEPVIRQLTDAAERLYEQDWLHLPLDRAW